MFTDGLFRTWLIAPAAVFSIVVTPASASNGAPKEALITCGAEFDHHAHGPRRPGLVEGSLPTEVPRPGPAVLYWPLATSPQIENTGPWHAEPILISGASAYRRGEFLYQDFLYDDTGARGNPTSSGGTYAYPTDPVYARNAADLVEVRIKLLDGGTGIRLTYNTMLDPELVAATIILGDAAGTRPLPYGANAQAPAEVFVTVHGSSADAIDAASGEPIEGVVPGVDVDLHRRQVHLCIPFEAFDPRGQSSVRIAAAVGLWDVANILYLLPLSGPPDEAHPGGAGDLTSPPGFFNVAFRYDEPSSGFGAAWRDTAQAGALALGDLSSFFASVDFVALQRGINDDMPDQVRGVPQAGYMNRILVSHFEDAQGRGSAVSLQPENCPDGCDPPQYAGRLQPYEIYVPISRPPHSRYGLVVNPHAAGGNHNNYLAFVPREQVQFGERDAGSSIVITPNARGTAYWYYGEAGADVFEVWADVAHHYRLDPRSTLLGGLSMGGYATWKLGGQFPDLFAATPMMVPCPSAGVFYQPGGEVPGGVASLTRLLAPSFRNVPQLIWVGNMDPVCAYWAQLEYADLMDQLGYRYRIYSFPVGHAFPLGNEFTPMADWMDSQQVLRDPPRVTYVMNAEMHEPDVGLDADHAYWVSGVRVRDTTLSPPVGSIDVFSHGFGIGDPEPTETEHATGEYITESGQPISWELQARGWGTAPQMRRENRIDIVAENIRAVTIHPGRARVNCHVDLHVQSDGPIRVTLAGCGGDEGEGPNDR